MDIADANVRIIIAASLVMIVVLLTYIAFFKESAQKGTSKRVRE